MLVRFCGLITLLTLLTLITLITLIALINLITPITLITLITPLYSVLVRLCGISRHMSECLHQLSVEPPAVVNDQVYIYISTPTRVIYWP